MARGLGPAAMQTPWPAPEGRGKGDKGGLEVGRGEVEEKEGGKIETERQVFDMIKLQLG